MNDMKQPDAMALADALDELDAQFGYPGLCGQSAAKLRLLHAKNKQLRAAIAKLHAAKGRYHTQIAACDLYDLCNLKNERPTK